MRRATWCAPTTSRDGSPARSRTSEISWRPPVSEPASAVPGTFRRLRVYISRPALSFDLGGAMEHKETNFVRDESSGTVREESTVVNDTGATPVREASMVKSSTPARRWMEVIYLVFGIIDGLLLIRLVLKLLGANAHAGFASFTYGLTDFLLAPFHGLLPTFVSGKSVFEL